MQSGKVCEKNFLEASPGGPTPPCQSPAAPYRQSQHQHQLVQKDLIFPPVALFSSSTSPSHSFCAAASITIIIAGSIHSLDFIPFSGPGCSNTPYRQHHALTAITTKAQTNLHHSHYNWTESFHFANTAHRLLNTSYSPYIFTFTVRR